MGDVIGQVREKLEQGANGEVRRSGEKFFREKVRMYGLKTAAVTKIAKAFFKSVGKGPKEEIFGLCEELWKSGMMEESFIACNWSYGLRDCYSEEDFAVFERWVNCYVSNWAACDTLCNHTIGAFVERFPRYVENLKEWTASDNRWVRRASAVSLIVPARKGLFKEEVFQIADRLLPDEDDLVRKGYGWLLKVAGSHHQREVFDFVMSRRDVIPRTALRYAIEKMSPEMRKEAMKR